MGEIRREVAGVCNGVTCCVTGVCVYVCVWESGVNRWVSYRKHVIQEACHTGSMSYRKHVRSELWAQ